MQVHILEDPSEEELGWKLEKLHPDFLVFHGECLPGKDDVGGLVLRDGKAVTSEILTPLFTLKIPNLVCLVKTWTLTISDLVTKRICTSRFRASLAAKMHI